MPEPQPRTAAPPPCDADVVRTAAEAYVWAYPALLGYRELWTEVRVGGLRFDAFRHDGRLPAPGDGSRWADPLLLASGAWLDLRAGPVVVAHPDLPADSYAGLQVVDLLARTVAHLGVVASGASAGAWAVAGPGPDAPTPAGVRGMLRAQAGVVRLVARATAATPGDLPVARAVLAACVVRPPHGLGGVPRPRAAPPVDWLPWDEDRASGAGFVDYLALLLRSGRPAHGPERELVDRCAALGVLPGPRSPVLDARTRALVARGAALGAAQIRDEATRDPHTSAPSGSTWLRRAVAAGTGLSGPGPHEVAADRWDRTVGEPLTGRRRYRLTFAGDHVPPSRLSWALAAYVEPTGDLVANPLRRYAIGPRTPGVSWASDGSFTVAVQHSEPADPRARANWLPAPAGAFSLVLRRYAPGPAPWAPPELRTTR